MTFRPAIPFMFLWLAAPALAEARSETLLDLLSHVPASLIESSPGYWSNLRFADLEAAEEALKPLPKGADAQNIAVLGPWARVFLPGLSHLAQVGLEGGWEPRVGFAPPDVDAGLVAGQHPETVTLLRLDTEAAARVTPALLALDYDRATREGVTALIRGAEDHVVDPTYIDPADPLADFGRASRVSLEGNLLVRASGWPELLSVLDEESPRGPRDLPALAAVLDRPDWGTVELLQAFFLPDQLDIGPTGAGGPPPWRIGMVADLGSGAEAVTLALFTYPDRMSTEAAAIRLAEAWEEPISMTPEQLAELQEPPRTSPPSLQELAGAAAETGVAGEGPFVAWLAIRSPIQAVHGFPKNMPFEVLWRTLLSNGLKHFGAP